MQGTTGTDQVGRAPGSPGEGRLEGGRRVRRRRLRVVRDQQVDAEDLRRRLNLEAVVEFLLHLFRGVAEGWIVIRAHDPETDESYNDWIRVSEIADKAPGVIEQYNGMNIWFGPATRRENLGRFRQGGVKDCKLLSALVLDVDVYHPNPNVHKEQNLPATFEEAKALIDRFPLPATDVVNTGFGLQPYWVFAEPLEADETPILLAGWNATWQRIFAGLHLDNISNLDRVTRLPGGVNQKDICFPTKRGETVTGEPRRVLVESADWGRLYNPSDFDDLLDPVPEPPPPKPHRDRSGRLYPEAEWFNQHHDGGDVLKAFGSTLAKTYKDRSADWYRPGKKRGTHSATVYPDHVAIWSTGFGIPTSLADRKTYDPWGLHVHLNYGPTADDFKAAAKALRAKHSGLAPEWDRQMRDRAREWVRTHADRDRGGGAEEGEREGAKTPSLPDEFWNAHRVLAHIRQAANNRLCSPEALLLACLARVASRLPPSLMLPPIVGGKVPLCLGTINVGLTGMGKTSASKVSAELLPWQGGLPDELPLGSGEGLVEVLFDDVQEIHDSKKRTVRKQVHTNVYVYVDEGAVLGAIANRSGSTLLANIRTILTGGVLGNTNASRDRRRYVPLGRYAYGVVVGLQAALAGPLLTSMEIAAGTPARFIWTPSLDPTGPASEEDDADWPGPLDWESPSPEQLIPLAEMPWDADLGWSDEAKTNAKFHIVPVTKSVQKAIKDHRRAVLRGEVQIDELKAHALLLREKVAALLSILSGTGIEVSEEWWGWAKVMLETVNDPTLAWVQAELAADAVQKERRESARHARKQVDATAATEQWRIVECAKKIWARVKEEPGISRRSLYSILKYWREVLEEGLAHALGEGWIVEKNQPSHTGSDSRAFFPGEKQP